MITKYRNRIINYTSSTRLFHLSSTKRNSSDTFISSTYHSIPYKVKENRKVKERKRNMQSLHLINQYNSSSSALLTRHLCSSSSNKSTTISPSSSPPVSLSWIDNSKQIPEWMKPYLHLARADKQIGTLLLLWPCWWSIALAMNNHIDVIPDVFMMSKFMVGAVIMRSAGCTINDMWDMEYDKNVARTKNRPLASGALTIKQALTFLSIQLSTGLAVLCSLNTTCISLGVCSVPLVIAYPLMKRLTNWPQLFLGATINWGALMGYPAITGTFDMSTLLPLYLAGISWTLIYDTLYAYQDRSDDRKLGLKSTALHFGDNPQVPLSLIGLFGMTNLALVGINGDLNYMYFIGTQLFCGQLFWQIWSAQLDNTQNLWKRFDSNKYSGALVLASIVAGEF